MFEPGLFLELFIYIVSKPAWQVFFHGHIDICNKYLCKLILLCDYREIVFGAPDLCIFRIDDAAVIEDRVDRARAFCQLQIRHRHACLFDLRLDHDELEKECILIHVLEYVLRCNICHRCER